MTRTGTFLIAKVKGTQVYLNEDGSKSKLRKAHITRLKIKHYFSDLEIQDAKNEGKK